METKLLFNAMILYLGIALELTTVGAINLWSGLNDKNDYATELYSTAFYLVVERTILTNNPIHRKPK